MKDLDVRIQHLEKELQELNKRVAKPEKLISGPQLVATYSAFAKGLESCRSNHFKASIAA
jgi:hypothetical protein